MDGAVQTKPGYKLSAGELVRIDYPAPAPQQISAERLNFDIEILYEDEDLLVVNKPAGLTVHPAASVKEPTLVDWLKSRGYLLSTLGGELRAGIVHRLDKLTSGALLVAKNNAAHANKAIFFIMQSFLKILRFYLFNSEILRNSRRLIEFRPFEI